jgi:hypothetical protein
MTDLDASGATGARRRAGLALKILSRKFQKTFKTSIRFC